MTNSLPLLFAAPGLSELISILIGLVVTVMYLIGQFKEAKKDQQGPVPARPPVDVPPQPAARAAMAGGPPPADPLRAQIDEFLRRAGQPARPPQAAVPQRPPRQLAGRDEVVVLLEDTPAEPARKPLADTLRSRGEAAEAMRAKPAQPAQPQPPRERRPRPPQRVAQSRPKSVAEHVAERVGVATQEFQKEVANLGERVKQADEQFDVQLQQKFDHELGSLGNRHASRVGDQPPAADTTSPAAQIVALLASPAGVRQAIVLNEILRRPEDRW